MKHLAKFLKNRIWFIAAAVLLVLLAVQGCGKLYEPAMALEQLARCGETEHVHTEECYMDELLICGTRAHTHGENCYIFRVDENDLNAILTDMGEKEIYSLEDYMAHTLSSVYGEGANLDDILRYTSIEELNAAIAASGDSKLRFNAAMDLPAAYAIGDPVSTANYKANFYIYLDNAWTHIGTMDYTIVSSWWEANRTISTSNILQLINEVIYPDYDSLSTNVKLFYMTSKSSNSTWYSGTISTNNTTFGNAGTYSWNQDVSAIHVRVKGTSDDNNSEIPSLKFYTVTLDYSEVNAAKPDDVQYVRSGVASSLTLSDEYQWVDDEGDVVDSLPTTITAKTTLYAKWPPKNCTVTYKDVNGKTIKDSEQVASGSNVTLPYGYKWRDGAGNSYDGGASVKITGDTNFVGTPIYTVSFVSNGSEVATRSVEHGQKLTDIPAEPKRDGHSFGGWYTDATCTHAYDFNTKVTGSFTLYAKWTLNKHTVIFINGKTKEPVETRTDIPYGSVITLPEAVGGTYWQLEGGGVYSPGDEITVTGNMTFTSTDKVTATFIYKDGTTDVYYAKIPNESITIPDVSSPGNVWLIEGGDGEPYYPDGQYTLSKNTTFVESSVLNVSYNVNFPSASDFSYASTVTRPTAPTVVGNTPQSVVEGSNLRANGISASEIIAKTADSRNFGFPIYFEGWQTETGELISPDSQLTWDQLLIYDKNSNGTVDLSGKWSYGMLHTVNFVVRYDSKAVDINGNIVGGDKTAYTDCLFTTYVGGADIDTLSQPQLQAKYAIADTTSDNSYTADQNIRALYGEKSEGIWLYSFPKDEDVFAKLKELSQKDKNRVLTVDGEAIDLDKLDSKHYSIRWYVFKVGNSANDLFDDGWHVDGKLVKKEGTITVSKLFGGVEAFYAEGKDGFHVDVVAGTIDSAGTFQPFTGSKEKHYVLYLPTNTVGELKAHHPDALGNIPNSYFIPGTLGNDGIYHWKIAGMELDEIWQITEHPPEAGDEFAYYAEYTVTDSDGTTSAIAEYGTRASVVGKVYALDEDANQGLTVDFSNYYYNSESILIKKEDADTGKPIGNTAFEFYQDGKLLQFELENGGYFQSPDGTYSQIVTADDGFSTIALNGFNFQQGDITVKEVSAPHGYRLAPKIVITGTTTQQADGTYVTTDINISSIEGVAEADWGKHAEYIRDDLDDDGSIDVEALVVKDKSVTANVTANKIWPDGKSAESVTIVLQADGNRATATFPTIENVEVVLSAANDWTHEWNDLPAYANGKLVSWSIKEIKVGNETTMIGSDNFAYWVHTYTSSQSDANNDGIAEWYLTVANRVRRSMLVLTKTNMAGIPLEGAEFTLTPVEPVDNQWCAVNGAAVRRGISDANGEINFDNLDLMLCYRLSETAPPLGYTKAFEDTVLALDGSGIVYVCSIDDSGNIVKSPLSDYGSSYIVYESAYNISVRNEAMPAFPNTGGEGTDVYIRLGALLMLAAAAAVIYKTKRRKEGDASAV